MASQVKPVIRKPPRFDLRKAKAVGAKVIRENKEWLKEMAKK